MHLPRYADSTTPDGDDAVEVTCQDPECGFTTSATGPSAQARVDSAYSSHHGWQVRRGRTVPSQYAPQPAPIPEPVPKPEPHPGPRSSMAALPAAPAPRSTWKTLLTVVPLAAAILVGTGALALQQDRDEVEASGVSTPDSEPTTEAHDVAPGIDDGTGSGPVYSRPSPTPSLALPGVTDGNRKRYLVAMRTLDRYYEVMGEDELIDYGLGVCAKFDTMTYPEVVEYMDFTLDPVMVVRVSTILCPEVGNY